MKASAVTSDPLRTGSSPRPAAELAWATWPAALSLLAAVLLVRLAYMLWLSPVELAGDEAYYWEQARHLDWCYNEKGPLLAWMIAASVRLFGNAEWTVRLPMLVAFIASAWGVWWLALAVFGRELHGQRAAFFAVAIFCLLP